MQELLLDVEDFQGGFVLLLVELLQREVTEFLGYLVDELWLGNVLYD